MELTASTTVAMKPDSVYSYWRRLENLPTFMAHVESIRAVTETRSAWTVSAPFGQNVSWEAEITEDLPGERLAWRTVNDADVSNAGTVTFTPAPGGRGTEVRVTLTYDMPGGKVGELVARLFGEDPRQQLDDDLRRFKQVMETGDIVRSDGAPYGKRARKEFPQRPAQPMTAEELAELRGQEVTA